VVEEGSGGVEPVMSFASQSCEAGGSVRGMNGRLARVPRCQAAREQQQSCRYARCPRATRKIRAPSRPCARAPNGREAHGAAGLARGVEDRRRLRSGIAPCRRARPQSSGGRPDP
jgi:hypothetical protein